LILADIKQDTLCLDPGDLLKKITSKTKGVIVVHIAGLPCPDLEEIKKICRERKMFLIEDASHAHGATINGYKTGSLGDAGCFSFYATKVMTTSTGGMITTNNDGLAEYAKSLRNFGVGRGLDNVTNLGNDWLMDEISAVLGIHQLKALENNIAKRNEIARKYETALAKMQEVALFTVPNNFRHSYYKYPILLLKSINKHKLIEKMKNDFGVNLGSIYDPPCHLQPIYKNHFGFRRGMFPVAEETLERTVCLPMFSQITDAEIKYVLQSLKMSLSVSKE
jgi:perosamine synthetase